MDSIARTPRTMMRPLPRRVMIELCMPGCLTGAAGDAVRPKLPPLRRFTPYCMREAGILKARSMRLQPGLCGRSPATRALPPRTVGPLHPSSDSKPTHPTVAWQPLSRIPPPLGSRSTWPANRGVMGSWQVVGRLAPIGCLDNTILTTPPAGDLTRLLYPSMAEAPESRQSKVEGLGQPLKASRACGGRDIAGCRQ